MLVVTSLLEDLEKQTFVGPPYIQYPLILVGVMSTHSKKGVEIYPGKPTFGFQIQERTKTIGIGYLEMGYLSAEQKTPILLKVFSRADHHGLQPRANGGPLRQLQRAALKAPENGLGTAPAASRAKLLEVPCKLGCLESP